MIPATPSTAANLADMYLRIAATNTVLAHSLAKRGQSDLAAQHTARAVMALRRIATYMEGTR